MDRGKCMQQIIPDIDPWKFRVFSPEECPTEVLEKLPFGECVQSYSVRNQYITICGYPKALIPNDFARVTMDRAYTEGKDKLYPELGFSSATIKHTETLSNSDRSHAMVMYTVPIINGLINFDDSKESINFWQDTYTQRMQSAVMDYFKSYNIAEAEDAFIQKCITPKVYYDTEENLIYNRVTKLHAGEYCVIPMYVSAYGGAIIVKALHDCIIPLGTGRCRSVDQARDWVSESREHKSVRNYHLDQVSNSYRDYSCIEFNDKSILIDVLAKLPVRIVEELHTYLT